MGNLPFCPDFVFKLQITFRIMFYLLSFEIAIIKCAKFDLKVSYPPIYDKPISVFTQTSLAVLVGTQDKHPKYGCY